MADAATAEIAVKPQLSAKDEVRALLDRLPDTVTLEDIAYHIGPGQRLLSNVPGGFEESRRPEYISA